MTSGIIQLPAAKDVRDMLEGLVGRSVVVSPGAPVTPTPDKPVSVAVYVDPGMAINALCILDLYDRHLKDASRPYAQVVAGWKSNPPPGCGLNPYGPLVTLLQPGLRPPNRTCVDRPLESCACHSICS